MLKSLSLKNFMSHAQTTLEFKKGVNLFVGPMGSGKTSVLEAICIALFGDYPAGSRSKAKLSDLIRMGEEFAEIHLEFEHKQRNYKIVRKIKRKGQNEAVMFIDGKLAEVGPRRVTDRVERILEINYEMFRRVIVAAQNELDAVLSLPPSERKRVMDKLMGIEDIQSVMEKANRMLRRIRASRLTIAKEMETFNIEERKKELEKTINDIGKAEHELNSIKDEIKAVEKALKEVNIKYREMFKLKKEYEALSQRKSKLLGIVSTLKNISSFDEQEFYNVEKKLNKVRQELKSIKVEIEQIDKSIKDMEKRKAVLERKKKEKQELQNELKKLMKSFNSIDISKKEEIEKEVEGLREHVASIRASLKEAEKHYDELKKSTTECPVCLRPLNEERKKELKTRWVEKIKTLKQSLDKSVANLNNKLKYLKELEEKAKEKQKLSILIKRIEQKIRSITIDDLESIAHMIANNEHKKKQKETIQEELQNTVHTLTVKYEQLKKSKEMLDKKRKAESLLRTVEEKLNNLQYNETEFEKTVEEKNNYDARVKVLKERVERVKEKRQMLEKIKTEVEERIKMYEKSLKKLEKLDVLIEEIGMFRDALAELQVSIRTEFITALNELLPMLWSVLYPYNDYRAVKIIASEGYDFYGFVGGRWVDITTFASGGERMSFAIALRIAFASILAPTINMLFFDEPTHNLDEKAIERFGILISEKLPKVVGQAFIITHDEKLKSPEIGNLYVFERKKIGSDPTTVKQINNKPDISLQ